MACERHSRPSTQVTQAVCITALLAHLQPLSTTQTLHTNHHFPRPPGASHTRGLAHIIPSAGKMPRGTGPISACALSRQVKHCRVCAQQDAAPRAESGGAAQCTQHGIIKKRADIYTFARRQLSARFSGEKNWEATGRWWKLLSSCSFVPLELGEYLIYSQ